ncbi:MAG: AMP-binding protein [Qipengyuania sp.]|nr:AMP-binding protein [Qipengyuania sp.]
MNFKQALAALDSAPHWRKRAPYLEAWRQAGLHSAQLTGERIAERVAAHPDVPIVFGSRERPSQATAAELLRESYEIAAAFHRLGLREGDVLVSQMPNWREGTLTLLAALHLGLIFVPMVHIYGPAEMAFIMNTVGAKAVVVPDRWKKIDYGARIGALGDVPTLELVIVVGDESMPGQVTRWRDLDRGALQLPALSATSDDPWLIMFTSGTTSAPKGVVHTHNSFGAEVPLFPTVPSPEGRPKLLPLPAGHSAGVIAALRPFLAADACLMMDAWDEDLAVELIKRHRPDRAGGVPFMVSFLLDRAAELFPTGMVQLSVGAASVPSTLMERCEQHRWPGTRTYGSTEHPTISGATPADPFQKRATTDGRLLAGVQIRLVDDEGATVGEDLPGEIVSMGPELFKGYIDPSHNAAGFAEDGWFHTGDMGQLDADGYLRIVDRKKDIIIRGGENISSKEVEDVLTLHPAVAEAAVVAWPDARMGEKVGVFVRLKPDAALSTDDIAAHFAAAGIARQKTPERLVIVDDFPRTPAGKILKTELRERVKSLAAQERDPA